MEKPHFHNGPHGRLAYRRCDGAGPGLLWLGGFRSDMNGAKASFLAAWAARAGRAFLRFDYSGHGASDGHFEDGAVSAWRDDALAMLDGLTHGAQILVGSSMGAWIAILVALARPTRVAGLTLLAPAADFTQELIWKSLDPAGRARLEREGRIDLAPANADAPLIVTKKLIEDGRRNLVLNGPIPITAPVRILQGMADCEVPFAHALRLAEALQTSDLEILLIKAGDHGLSAPADLVRLVATIEQLAPGSAKAGRSISKRQAPDST